MEISSKTVGGGAVALLIASGVLFGIILKDQHIEVTTGEPGIFTFTTVDRGTLYVYGITDEAYRTEFGEDIAFVKIIKWDGSERQPSRILTSERTLSDGSVLPEGTQQFVNWGASNKVWNDNQYIYIPLRSGPHHLVFVFGSEEKGYVKLDAFNDADPLNWTNWTKENGMQYINNSVAYISVYPDVRNGSGYVYGDFVSKQRNGCVEMLVGSPAGRKNPPRPMQIDRYSPLTWNETFNHSCFGLPADEFCNFTNGGGSPPNTFWHWRNTSVYHENVSGWTYSYYLLFSHSFTKKNASTGHFFWNETYNRTWLPITHKFKESNDSWLGMGYWLNFSYATVTAGQNYSYRIWFDVIPTFGENSGKYTIGFKPCNKNVSQSIKDEQMFVLDPVWNSSFSNRRYVNMTTSSTAVPSNFTWNVTWNFSTMTGAKYGHMVCDVQGVTIDFDWINYTDISNPAVNGSIAWGFKDNLSMPANTENTTKCSFLYNNNTPVDRLNNWSKIWNNTRRSGIGQNDVTFGKTATASSCHPGSCPGDYPAGNAIDDAGGPSADSYPNTWVSTSPESYPSWWSVDLGDKYIIWEANLTNAGGDCVAGGGYGLLNFYIHNGANGVYGTNWTKTLQTMPDKVCRYQYQLNLTNTNPLVMQVFNISIRDSDSGFASSSFAELEIWQSLYLDNAPRTSFLDEEITELDAPNVTNITFFALNSSKGVLGSDEWFNADNLTAIEFMNISFNVSDVTGISDDIVIYFTANGSNGCAIGNVQSSTCYNNISGTWVHFANGTTTSTFNDTGTQGDFIVCSWIGNSTLRKYNCQLDEHYNPNVDKHYPYDFADVNWQSGATRRIKANTQWLYELDTANVPLDADFYKLDFRVNYTATPPTESVLAYLCNSTYETGLGAFDASNNCQLVASKLPSELQDDGTKFRGIFTKNLTSTLGDIKFVGITSQTGPAEYYFMKSVKYIGSGGIRTNVSTNGGLSYAELGSGYESEININWFYNESATNGTAILIKVEAIDTADVQNMGNSSEASMRWTMDTGVNLPPIVEFITPLNFANVSGFTWINFTALDPNGDEFETNLSLNNGTTFIAVDMDTNNRSYYWDTSQHPDGTYNLTGETCEINTVQLFCAYMTHNITIDNTFPLVVTNLSNATYTQSFDIYFNATDTRGISSLWYSNDSGATNSTIFTSNATISLRHTTDGLKNVTFYVNDTAGNLNTTAVFYSINLPLQLSFIYPTPANGTLSVNLTYIMNLSSNLPLDIAWVQWENSTGKLNVSMTSLNTTNFQWNTSENFSLSVGVYYWSVFANKSNGLSGNWSGNYTLNISKVDSKMFIRQDNGSYVPSDIIYDLWCSYNETQCAPTNQDSTYGILQVKNNGSVIGNYIHCKVNQTVNEITAWIGNTSNYSLAVNMTTTFQTLWNTSILPNTNKTLWIWEDWAFSTSFDVIEYDCEVVL